MTTQMNQGTSVQAPDSASIEEEQLDEVNWADLATSDLDVEGEFEVAGAEGDGESPAEPGSQSGQQAAQQVQGEGTPPAAAPSGANPGAQQPVQQPAATTTSQEPAGQAQQQPAQQTQQQQPQTPTAQQPDYQAWRASNLDALSKEYALSDEEATAMLTEPEKVIPKLAATLHMKVVEHAMRSIQAMVPQMMQQVQLQNTQETKARDEFFGVNDDLKDAKYEQAILMMGSQFRAVNPKATPVEAALAIGNLVRVAMGMAPRMPGVQQQQVAQAAVVQPQTQRAVFAPARGGGGGVGARPVSDNPFSQLADEFLQDD